MYIIIYRLYPFAEHDIPKKARESRRYRGNLFTLSGAEKQIPAFRVFDGSLTLRT
jgi:hypothetical protein